MQLIGFVNLQCSTTKVHPLIYGTGTWGAFLNSVDSYGTGETIVGGMSMSRKAGGEGFLMRLDQYGKIMWQKSYINSSSDTDSIERVAKSGTNILGAGLSLTGSTNSYFVLRFSSTGTLTDNYRIGTDTTKVNTNSRIVHFSARPDSSVVTLFGSVLKNTISFFSFSSGTQETYLTLQTAPSSTIIWARQFSATSMSMISVYGGKIATMYKDSATESNSKAKYVTNDVSTFSSFNDMSAVSFMPDESYGWMAAFSTGANAIYGFLITPAINDYPALTKGYRLANTFSGVSLMVIASYDQSKFIIVCLDESQTARLLLVSHDGSTVTVIYRYITGINNYKFSVAAQTGGFTYGFSLVGAESSSLRSPQAAVYRSTNTLDFTTYNCFDVPSGAAVTIASYTLAEADITGAGFTTLNGYVTVGTAAKSSGTDSFLSDTTSFVIRAQSTRQDASNVA